MNNPCLAITVNVSPIRPEGSVPFADAREITWEYRVKSTQNTTDPVVHSVLTAEDLELLITKGVTVNIK